RIWRVSVLTEEETIALGEDRRHDRREERRRDKERTDDETVAGAIDSLDPDRKGITRNALRTRLGWRAERIAAAIGRLTRGGVIGGAPLARACPDGASANDLFSPGGVEHSPRRLGGKVGRGNRIVGIRVEASALAQWEEAVRSRNWRTAEPPWSLSDFVRACV